MKLLYLSLIGWAVMAVVFTITWLWQKRSSNAGIVDVVWSFATGLMCAVLSLGSSGTFERRILVAALAAAWAGRLGVHLFVRVVGESEDGRYQDMRRQWGDKAQRNFFIFFQMQALWTVLFAIPLSFAAQSPATFPQWFDFAGAIVWLTAVVGEGIADRQLAGFRHDPANKGKVCQVGLWHYSRHPNYFFEWVHWFAYVLIGIGGPYWWATLFGPAVMGFFLYKVTGIPYTEQRAIQSRGEAYREYQRTTSAFIPLPPKKVETAS